MLNHRHFASRRSNQRGIVLILALIVLAAMTLAGIGLTRSVFTTNKIAGNLAFQQAATNAADAGIEQAIAWLEANNVPAVPPNVPKLYNNVDPAANELGYFASRQDPAPGQSWEQFWNGVLVNSNRINTLPAQIAGNTVSFVIHRLCNAAGDPTTGIGCDASPTVVGSEGSGRGAGVPPISIPSQRYYRITVRVAGPRNTVSFVQSIVAL
jgi:Tfp pilus assembly protein PilX